MGVGCILLKPKKKKKKKKKEKGEKKKKKGRKAPQTFKIYYCFQPIL